MSKKRALSTMAAIGLAVMLMALVDPTWSLAQDITSPAPTPIGAWFGIARPCTAPAVGSPAFPFGSRDQFPDPEICKLACGGQGCLNNTFPLLEVTMIPTLLADGTVMADDFAELVDRHTTAQGKWEYVGKVKVGEQLLEKYQATFIWFASPPSPAAGTQIFAGVVRPRFVTFFDKDNPDEMRGYIQPYYYPFTEPDPSGIGLVRTGNTRFPIPNPMNPLPTSCIPGKQTEINEPSCYGTLHFVIHRIPAH